MGMDMGIGMGVYTMHEAQSSMELLPRELESISIAASQAMTTQPASRGTLRAPSYFHIGLPG